jgi:hypothetical protein
LSIYTDITIMMKQFAILALLACALCAVQGRQLKQAQTLAQALTSAQNTRVSTLIAAVQVGWQLLLLLLLLDDYCCCCWTTAQPSSGLKPPTMLALSPLSLCG